MQILTPAELGSGEIPDAPHRLLWLTVLELAVEDALGRDITFAGKTKRVTVMRMARSWLTRGGGDFQLVCLLAGVEWEWALRVFRERFPRNGRRRDGRG